MCELVGFRGEPIVSPDDIAGSLDTSVIFFLENYDPDRATQDPIGALQGHER
jgi:hypothetical protein